MIKKNIEIVEIDNEWIVMDMDKFTVTRVNSIGAYILKELKENKSLQEIVKEIEHSYEIDADLAMSDALSFLKELHGAGLVTNEEA